MKEAAVCCLVFISWWFGNIGNTLVSVNKVAVHWAWLVVGWRQPSGRLIISICNHPPRPTQPGHPSMCRCSEHWQQSMPVFGKKTSSFMQQSVQLVSGIGCEIQLAIWPIWVTYDTATFSFVGFSLCWLKPSYGMIFHTVDICLIFYSVFLTLVTSNGRLQIRTFIECHGNQRLRTTDWSRLCQDSVHKCNCY